MSKNGYPKNESEIPDFSIIRPLENWALGFLMFSVCIQESWFYIPFEYQTSYGKIFLPVPYSYLKSGSEINHLN
jgi:hypothetical protein